MARIRTIKPEFFTSEDIVSLSAHARLLYIALWCEADRDGRMEWKPRTFKMRYLPADDVDVSALCQELISQKLIVLYGAGLAYIPQFAKHQHINPREAVSSLQEPDASARVSHASARVTDAQVGREGKGKEGDNTRQDADVFLRDSKGNSEGPTVDSLLAGVSPQVIADFKALRKAKKAAITPTAVEGIQREAAKAGMTLQAALAMCCERGWAGFKAEWLADKVATITPPRKRKQLGEGSSTNYGNRP